MATGRKSKDHANPQGVDLVEFYELELQEAVEWLRLHCPTKPRVMATPLFELFSVTIYSERDVPDNYCRIYGHIKLTDDDGNEIFLFKRGYDDPEEVIMTEPHIAILPKFNLDCPLLLPKCFRLELYLEEKNHCFEIINEITCLDFSGKVDYDKEEEVSFKRLGGGYATVSYIIFQCAVSASVEFTVLKNKRGSKSDRSDDSYFVSGKGSDCLFEDVVSGKRSDSLSEDVVSGTGSDDLCDIAVSGTISALSKVRDRKDVSRLLFGKLGWLPGKWVGGAPMKLSRLAVPAYSSLGIQANLIIDGEQIVSGDALEFEPNSYMLSVQLRRKLWDKNGASK